MERKLALLSATLALAEITTFGCKDVPEGRRTSTESLSAQSIQFIPNEEVRPIVVVRYSPLTYTVVDRISEYDLIMPSVHADIMDGIRISIEGTNGRLHHFLKRDAFLNTLTPLVQVLPPLDHQAPVRIVQRYMMDSEGRLIIEGGMTNTINLYPNEDFRSVSLLTDPRFPTAYLVGPFDYNPSERHSMILTWADGFINSLSINGREAEIVQRG